MLLGESPEDYDKHFILIADIDASPKVPGRKVLDRTVIASDIKPLPSVAGRGGGGWATVWGVRGQKETVSVYRNYMQGIAQVSETLVPANVQRQAHQDRSQGGQPFSLRGISDD